MKTIITTMASLLGIAISHAAPMTENDKADFVRIYRQSVKLAEEFPHKPEVKAMFIDLDGDGKDEALATCYGSFYETGWDWAAFRKVGEEWTRIRGFNNQSKNIDQGSTVFARHGEVFRVTTNDGAFEFVILGENFDKLAPEGKGPLTKTRFYLDKDGVLQQESIQDLERYLAYRVSGNKWPEGSLIKGLEALKVEVFKD